MKKIIRIIPLWVMVMAMGNAVMGQANTSNPYDYAGRVHNEILSKNLESKIENLTIQQI
jgi:hypothetical protein